MLPIVYDYEPKAKDDYIIHIMRRYVDLVVAGLSPVAIVVLEVFPFRMFTHAVFACSQISLTLLLLSLTAAYLVSRCYVQASVTRMSPGRSRCEGDPLPTYQREDGESHH